MFQGGRIRHAREHTVLVEETEAARRSVRHEWRRWNATKPLTSSKMCTPASDTFPAGTVASSECATGERETSERNHGGEIGAIGGFTSA